MPTWLGAARHHVVVQEHRTGFMPGHVCTELHSGFCCCKECFSVMKDKYHGGPNPGSFGKASTFSAKMDGTVCFSRRVRGMREGCGSALEVALWSRAHSVTAAPQTLSQSASVYTTENVSVVLWRRIRAALGTGGQGWAEARAQHLLSLPAHKGISFQTRHRFYSAIAQQHLLPGYAQCGEVCCPGTSPSLSLILQGLFLCPRCTRRSSGAALQRQRSQQPQAQRPAGSHVGCAHSTGAGGVMQSQSHKGWKSPLRSPPCPLTTALGATSPRLWDTPSVADCPAHPVPMHHCSFCAELLPAPSRTVPLSPCATCHHWAPEECCAGAAAALPIPAPSLSSLREKKTTKTNKSGFIPFLQTLLSPDPRGAAA